MIQMNSSGYIRLNILLVMLTMTSKSTSKICIFPVHPGVSKLTDVYICKLISSVDFPYIPK
jgi:hypothetical protein